MKLGQWLRDALIVEQPGILGKSHLVQVLYRPADLLCGRTDQYFRAKSGGTLVRQNLHSFQRGLYSYYTERFQDGPTQH